MTDYSRAVGDSIKLDDSVSQRVGYHRSVGDEVRMSDDVLIELGPVTARAAAKLDLTIEHVDPASDPSAIAGRRAIFDVNHVGWLVALTGFCGWAGQLFNGRA